MRPYGSASKPRAPIGPLAPDLTRSTTFAGPDAETLRAVGAGEQDGEFYPRYGHPAARRFESAVAVLEGAEGAVSFASGMAALHGPLCALLGAGDTLAASGDVYGGTGALLRDDLPRFGVNVVRFDALDERAWDAALAQRPKLVLVESPTNPLCRTVDLTGLAQRARSAGALTMVDATFAPPPLQRPIEAGIDLVMHSATKFFSGHHDCLGGVVSGRHELLGPIEAFRRRTGAILAPDTAWLLERSMRTLELRVRQGAETAARLAEFLAGRVRKVHYAGMGALLAFEVDDAAAVYNRFETVARAVSLGGVESTALIPAHASHVMIAPEERARLGIADDLIRVSVGLEPFETLANDLEQAIG